MDQDLVSGACSACLLTAAAEQLLSRLASDLRDTRGEDGSWASHTCSACGRITAVTDDREGWTFGDSGWSFHPTDEGRIPSVEDAVLGAMPEWLTPVEAAYVAGVPLAALASRMEGGMVEQVSLLGNGAGMLVRTRDVVAIGRLRTVPPTVGTPRRRRRRDGIGGITIILATVFALVFATAVWWVGRPSAEPSGDPSTVATEPVTEDLPGVAEPAQGLGADSTSETISGAAAPVSTAGIVIEPVAVVAGTDWVSAAVNIANTTGRWLPPSEVTFHLVDHEGQTIDTARSSVDLAPGESAVIVADPFALDPDAVSQVLVSLERTELRAASLMPGSLVVDRAVVSPASVSGRVVNAGPARASVRIDCAFYREGGLLSGVASDDIGPVPANTTTSFRINVEHAERPVGSATCSAT